MADLIEVVIDSLRVSLTNQQRIVILKAKDNDQYLPIWVGPYEAEAITIALQEVEVARPQTHDLLNRVFQLLKANLQKVIIADLKEDVFYATILAEVNGSLLEIDARPSDAIALALRAHIPILVESRVMQEAAIEPEEETDEEAEMGEGKTGETGGTAPVDRKILKDQRLSVFEDYLKKRRSGGSNQHKDDQPPQDRPDDPPKPASN
jgi:uncharacterized protein